MKCTRPIVFFIPPHQQHTHIYTVYIYDIVSFMMVVVIENVELEQRVCT